MERCQNRAEQRQADEDYDEEEEEVQAEAADRDDELLDSLTGVLASLTKTHKEWMQTAFVPYVEVFGALVQVLFKSQVSGARQHILHSATHCNTYCSCRYSSRVWRACTSLCGPSEVHLRSL